MLEKYGKNDARLIHEIVFGGLSLHLFNRNLKPSPIGPETAGKNNAKQELSPERTSRICREIPQVVAIRCWGWASKVGDLKLGDMF